ncbi:chromate transporter [uncultured Alistipes sp.]|uniref:chromate transporter n=1 Tax=uncultured Alistipes sp. TaxID=538949 RepID=UPI002628D03B|nr:chromate transporter [uncultured Alistipes sp.]
MRKSLTLFWTFLKIGVFTFGGGYAMVPLIEKEVVGRRRWIDGAEFIDLLTLAQTSPGPLALNTAVFVGYKIARYAGAFWAVMGVVVPSFVIILLIALFFASFRTNPVVEAVFKGMRPAVVALILAPIFNLSKGLGLWRLLLAAAALAATWALGFSPVYLILVGALGGLAFAYYRKRKGKAI